MMVFRAIKHKRAWEPLDNIKRNIIPACASRRELTRPRYEGPQASKIKQRACAMVEQAFETRPAGIFEATMQPIHNTTP
jgi:hypothetical protein